MASSTPIHTCACRSSKEGESTRPWHSRPLSKVDATHTRPRERTPRRDLRVLCDILNFGSRLNHLHRNKRSSNHGCRHVHRRARFGREEWPELHHFHCLRKLHWASESRSTNSHKFHLHRSTEDEVHSAMSHLIALQCCAILVICGDRLRTTLSIVCALINLVRLNYRVQRSIDASSGCHACVR